MASRSGGGMGVLVALIVFIMLNFVFVLTTMLFYSKSQEAEKQAKEAEAALQAFVSPQERQRDDIRQLVDLAGSQSVVSYLHSELQYVTQLVGGRANLNRSQLERQLENVGWETGETVYSMMQSMDSEIANGQEELATLRDELTSTQQRLTDEVNLREKLKEQHRSTLTMLDREVTNYRSLTDEYDRLVANSLRSSEDRVRGIRGTLDGQIDKLTQDVEDRDLEISTLSDALQSLQARLKETAIGKLGEGDQKDGEVIRVSDGGDIYLNLGRKHKIVLGMTFDIYTSFSDLKPDAAGNIAPGKATIEVVRVEDTTSTARVIRATPGRAVGRGDMLVNAIYDRDKEYSFFVYGGFDLDLENGPSEIETDVVRNRIEEWGGSLRDDFSGDIDFLVLGIAPRKPMPLRDRATAPEIRRWRAANRFYEQYNEYLVKAQKLSIPVLNQNRLFTLIGYYGN